MVLSVMSAALSPSNLQRPRHHVHHQHRYSQRGQRSHNGRFGLVRRIVGSFFQWTFAVTLLFPLISPYGGGRGVAALSCSACDPSMCPNTTDCPGGLVLDICRCCQVCARIENQSCGGQFGILGKCDGNLQCFIQPIDGRPIRGDEEGICKEIKEFKCNETNCPPAYDTRLCPPDSYLATSETRMSLGGSSRTTDDDVNIHTNRNEQNHLNEASSENDNMYLLPDQTSFCVCNTSLCKIPTCASGADLQLVQNATGLPGTCCNVFRCDKAQDCQSVMCPPFDEALCPEDSLRLPPVWTEDKCCELQQGCKCPPVEECQRVWCPAGFQVQVISRASRLPGSCCDKFRCVNESGLTCTYNGRELKNGETWNIDKCKSCECRDGLNRCKDKSCPSLSCTWMVIPEGECCPVCKGCVSDSGDLYNNSAEWKEGDCTTCKCRDGHAECQSEMCAVQCSNPVNVPGQCCPVCPHEEPSFVSRLCPSLEGCSISCKHGQAQTPEGCFTCKCKEEKCHLDCQFGLKSDVEGNTICECKAAEERCPPEELEPCEKKCEYGYKRSRDGCIKCKCNKCPPFNCTKRCIHGHILNDEGCELCKCKDLAVPELMNSNTEPENMEGKSCMSRDGSRHENGESWNDGCRTCYCHNGVEMCSLIACPAPRCSNPIFRVGDCCPTCPGLTIVSPNGEKELCQSSFGQYYVEGQTWKMDDCTQCVCHGGTILCETPSCPPVVCHYPIKREGECCATCREDHGLVPVPSHHYHHHRCTSTSNNGEVWQTTPCQSCKCQDGQVHCYNQMCPPLNCNRTVQRKGQCCPTCVETRKPITCMYRGNTYDSGEKWEGDNCSQCVCASGKTECFPLSCPHLDCSVMIRKRGQCCPECYDLAQLQPPNHGGNGVLINNQKNTTASQGNQSNEVGKIIGFAVLGAVIAIVVVIIVFVVICMFRRKHRSKYRPRPNAAKHEQQGQMPFIVPEQQTKAPNLENQYLEKLCPGITSDKRKGDRASNDYTEMVFPDQNKETMANGHFLSSVKS